MAQKGRFRKLTPSSSTPKTSHSNGWRFAHRRTVKNLVGTDGVFFGRLISENAASRSALNFMPAKIPKAMADKFAAIATLVDAFCAEHLNDEFRKGLIPYVLAGRMSE